MYRPIPPIAEPVDALKQRLQREHDGHRKPRLQMLYLFASGQAHTRQEVAQLLGLGRNTVGRWLTTYERGGLPALLHRYVPVGKRPSRAPEVLASLEQALHRPAGFAAYQELPQWVAQTHGVEVKDQTLYTIVRTRFRTKRKVPRPSHTKNPDGHGRVPGDRRGSVAGSDPGRCATPGAGLQPS